MKLCRLGLIAAVIFVAAGCTSNRTLTQGTDVGSVSTTTALGAPPPTTIVTTAASAAPPTTLDDEFRTEPNADDIIMMQVTCVYEKVALACADLEALGMTAAGNFGLGNSLTQAPDDVVIEQCLLGDRLFCAEQFARGITSDGPVATTGEIPDEPLFSAEAITELQLGCVYDGDQAACDLLGSAGLTPDTNFGLGNSLSQAPDDAAAADCAAQERLSCAEIASRYPAVESDEPAAQAFINTLIVSADIDSQAPQYLIDQMADVDVQVTSFDDVGYSYALGFFGFSLAPTTNWQCYIGQGQVRSCTFFAD